MIDYDVSLRYMLAGYTIILAVLAVYIISLLLKWRTLVKEYWLLSEEEKQ